MAPYPCNAQDILNATDRPSQTQTVPEWGGSVIIATLTGTERDQWEQSITNTEGKVTADNIRAKLLVRCIVDDQGQRLFTDDQADALGAKSAKVLSTLYNIASKLNGLSKEDVEELAKN